MLNPGKTRIPFKAWKISETVWNLVALEFPVSLLKSPFRYTNKLHGLPNYRTPKLKVNSLRKKRSVNFSFFPKLYTLNIGKNDAGHRKLSS